MFVCLTFESTSRTAAPPPSNEKKRGDDDCSYVVETGYIIAKDSWRKGYATESLQAMMTLAQQLGIDELIANVHYQNEVSSHILTRNGFTAEKSAASESPVDEFPNNDNITTSTQKETRQVQLYTRHFPSKQYSNIS